MSIATAPQQQLTLRQQLQQPWVMAEIAKALPAHCKPERMLRVVLTAMTRTPKLQQCTKESFFDCLLSLSQYGLEPDGRRAHLIPYGNRCTLVIDYKGYVELAYRSGVVRNIHADVVYTGDIFRYSMGKVLEHVPHFLRTDEGKPEDRGDVLAAYCIVELDGGTTKTEVMSKADVEAIRKRSKSGGSGPWQTDWNEMAKKTAFRRASKWIPLSADIRDAMDRDDDRLEVQAQPPQRTKLSDLDAVFAGRIEDDAGTIEGHISEESHEPSIDTDLIAKAREYFAAATTAKAVDEAEAELNQEAQTDSERSAIAGMADERRESLPASKTRGGAK